MSTFEFKYFSIKQEVAAVKVGTDAMLLGAFTSVDDAQHVLEIGTGTGVVSLMLAQKKSDLLVEALEIHRETALEAIYNVRNSSFNSQINIQIIDFLHFQPSRKYDLIVSNPPYFENGLIPEDNKLRLAKHIDVLTVNSWFQKISEFLAFHGECWLIIPYESLEAWTVIANSNSLFLKKKILLYSKPGVVKRVIISFCKIQKPSEVINFQIRNVNGEYTNEYILLTNQYHNRAPIR